MGMCLCRLWRRWIYRKKFSKQDNKGNHEPETDALIATDRKQSGNLLRRKQNQPNQQVKTHLKSNNDEKVPEYYKLALSCTQPPSKETLVSYEPPATASYGVCEMKIENIQPACDDILAYERLQSGHLALPTEIPVTPPDVSKDLGVIYFRISYDVFNHILKVFIDRAEQLPKMDAFGTSDPYVKISLTPNKTRYLETRVKRRSLAPIWNEIFTFTDFPHEKLKEKNLILQVFDYDRFSRDDEIGEVILPLQDIPMQIQPVEFVKELSPSTHTSGSLGDILLSLCYKTSDSHLTVIVMKGRKLKPMDVTGKSDPYVKVTLMNCGSRVARKRTSVKMKCLDPVWNEAMVFELFFSKIRDIQILVTLMDYNHYLPNKTVGQVVIGSRSTGAGSKHWTDMLNSPRTAIAMWHRVVK